MPLSDHEQRLLEQIERALYAEDPKFASTVRLTDLRRWHRRRVQRAAMILAIGLAAIVVGLILGRVLVVAIGAGVAAVGAAFTAFAWWQTAQNERLRAARRSQADLRGRGGPRESFRERMEERWQRRWDERDI